MKRSEARTDLRRRENMHIYKERIFEEAEENKARYFRKKTRGTLIYTQARDEEDKIKNVWLVKYL